MTAPYTLVLLRHGESEWNARNLFTGWVDVGLSDKGRDEAARGVDVAHEARLRARDAHVHERSARLDDVGTDHMRHPRGRHDDVGSRDVLGHVLRACVA